MTVESWGSAHARADCVTCGWKNWRNDETEEEQRRWAIRHAKANPRHQVRQVTESVRFYRALG